MHLPPAFAHARWRTVRKSIVTIALSGRVVCAGASFISLHLSRPCPPQVLSPAGGADDAELLDLLDGSGTQTTAGRVRSARALLLDDSDDE